MGVDVEDAGAGKGTGKDMVAAAADVEDVGTGKDRVTTGGGSHGWRGHGHGWGQSDAGKDRARSGSSGGRGWTSW